MYGIVKPLSSDGLLGFDERDQLWCWRPVAGGDFTGRMVPDLREQICIICGHGWELTAEAYADHCNWQFHGSEVHETCMVRYTSLHDYEIYHLALASAGLHFQRLQRIPNEYWQERDRWFQRSWYRVTLSDSKRTLKLGSRRHVHHLEIERGEGEIDVTMAQCLFEHEHVTKGLRSRTPRENTPKDWEPGQSFDGYYIHADNEDKVRDYIASFARILRLEKKP